MIPIDPSNPLMTTTAQQTVAEQNQMIPQADPAKDPNKKRNSKFKQEIDLTKAYRRKLVANWSVSIDYRRGKPFSSQSDQDQIAVPLDWSLTKSKQAALFSQIPQVRVSHHPESSTVGGWLPVFERKLNDTLRESGIESALDECLPDCINAAGIGVVIVSYDSITEDVEVPTIDLSMMPPEVAQEVMKTKMLDGLPVPTEVIPRVVNKRYVIDRVSPADFLWPLPFVGSNFDNAPWLGRSGRLHWAEASRRFKLKEEDKKKFLGEDRTTQDKLTHDIDRERDDTSDMVEFDEIFYKVYHFDPMAKSYETLHHLVFVSGKPEPVIDEPWNGQTVEEDGSTVLGARKFPIRVLSLTYITDEPIPPSDSAIGRSQVDEINKARGQFIRQRERNIPYRWADVNRVDPSIMQSLMRGTWQNVIPVQGDGTRIIGEVAKAGPPAEDFTILQMAKRELQESWTLGPNQLGQGDDVETKGESSEIAEGFQSRVGRERAKVASFVSSIAEVLGSLMCLYEEPTVFGEGFDKGFSRLLAYSILVDSTVLLDSNQKLQRYNQFLNMYAKSGWVSIEPVMREIATLSGLDPNVVIVPPKPAPPEKPNVSLRLTGADDMMNPLTLAFILGDGAPPTEELIEKAKQLIQQAVIMIQPPAPPAAGPGAPPEGTEPPIGGGPVPPSHPPGVGEANPEMASLPKITKRSNAPVEEQ